MRKRKVLTLLPLLLFAVDAKADRVCQTTSGLGFSDGHAGAQITGNWASVNFAFDASNNIIGGTGALWICNETVPVSCSTIDVNLIPDPTVPHGFNVTSDVVPGWGLGTRCTTVHKVKTCNNYYNVVAKFSIDDDSDLLLAKIVDLSGMGIQSLCGQLWNVLGASGGNPVCVQDSDCSIFAAGDVCNGGFCTDPIPGVSIALPWFFIAGAIQESQFGLHYVNGDSGPACKTNADCSQYALDPTSFAFMNTAPVLPGIPTVVCSTPALIATPGWGGGSFFVSSSGPLVNTCGYLSCGSAAAAYASYDPTVQVSVNAVCGN